MRINMAELERINHIEDKIEYCIDIILKEAKLEDVLVKQLFYTMLSMYTNDPRNLGIQSPTGEGKNYVIKKVADLFAKEDVIKYVGMTDKSIFHRDGKLVTKNANGEYEVIDEVLEKLDEDIEDKESQLSNTNDRNLKQALKSEIRGLEKEKKRLYKDAKKLIDLSHKCIIFLDTPPPGLLNAMMSLLSHDEYEVEYDFVDTHNGIKTKSNVLRGWPVMIFAQAIDYSHHKRYAEIQRRFPVTNPRMDEAKYKAAIQLIVHKHSVPDFLYQKTVVSDEQKDQAREIIKSLKEKIMDISTATSPGSNNVFIPFEEAIVQSLATKKSSDMTTADRIVGYLTLIAQVNVEDRPVIIYRQKGNPVTQKIPLATFADLKEALFLMQYSNGVRPYVLDFYRDHFLPAYEERNGEPNSKTSSDGKYTLKESRCGITTQQLAEAYFRNTGNKTSTRRIRDTYLDQLVNQGYVDSVSSDLDHRSDIYFPIVEAQQKDRYNGYTLFCPISHFPTANYLKSKILTLLENNDENTVCEIKNNSIDIDSLIEKYYNNPQDIFKKENDTAGGQNSNRDGDTDNDNDKNSCDTPDSRVSSDVAQSEPYKTNEGQKYESDSKTSYTSYSRISADYSCYYCDYRTDNEHDYERHVVQTHEGKPAYPNKAEIEKSGLKPQGKDWEV
jgi:hypothetical protein